MARLERSANLLFGTEPPAAARELVLDHARGVELGRLRLDVAPRGDGSLGAEARVADVDEATVFPAWERAVTLAPVEVAGGIGAHKWSDRRLLERAEANCAPALPLIVDSDEAVLEVSRGNVFLVRDGALITPPADGRMLPGVARQRIFDVATSAGIELREEPVSLEDPRRRRRSAGQRVRPGRRARTGLPRGWRSGRRGRLRARSPPICDGCG